MPNRSRRLASTRAPDERGRGYGYVESPSAMERALQEALERNRERLDAQRAEVQAVSEIRRAAVISGRVGQKQRGSSRPRT